MDKLEDLTSADFCMARLGGKNIIDQFHKQKSAIKVRNILNTKPTLHDI